MKGRRKKKIRVRQRDWESDADSSFTHDLKRHRRTDTLLSDSAPTPDIPEDFEPNGIVIAHSKKWAFVLVDGAEVRCRISDYLQEGDSTILAAGDRVLVQVDSAEEREPTVVAIAPRRTRLSRLAIEHSHVSEQVIAANVDVLVAVATAVKPAFKQGLVDRYLIAAEVGGVEPLLCMNKSDLVEHELPVIATYRELGIRVITTSCVTGEGIGDLRSALENRVSVFAGQSGVGKSTLLNALEPDLDIATREVSRSTEKGRHTTTVSRLYDLPGDIRVIDTPGIRQLGLWEVSPEEVAYYFPEIADEGSRCKFRDCTHTHEPGCAVLAVVEAGGIDKRRYDSYLRIRRSIEDQAQRE